MARLANDYVTLADYEFLEMHLYQPKVERELLQKSVSREMSAVIELLQLAPAAE